MAAFPRRTFLARRTGLGSIERVYRTRDAIEVDELEGYDVTRRRVLFDEVLLVTHHQEVGWAFVLAMLGVLTLTGFATMVVAIIDFKNGVATGVVTVLPFVALVALRLILRVDIITVHGPRSKARIPFWFQKDRAREVYRMVARLAREHQDRRARARPAAPPPGPSAAPPPEPIA